jgi:hypothetical protein
MAVLSFAVMMFVLHTTYFAIGKITGNKHFYHLGGITRIALCRYYLYQFTRSPLKALNRLRASSTKRLPG